VSAKTMHSIPALYSSGIRHELFTMSLFYLIVFESLYQSTIIFIVFTSAFGEASMHYNGQPPNGAEYGAMLAVTTLFNVNFFVGVMSYSLTIPMILTIALSNMSVFAATILCSVQPDSTLAGIAKTDFLNPNFWAAFLLSFVACHLPRVTIRFIMALSDPSDMDIILEQQKFGMRKEYLETKKSMANIDETQKTKHISLNMSTVKPQLELIKSGSIASLNSKVSWLDAGINPTDPSPKQTELNILTSDEIRTFNRRTLSHYRRSS
jgi:magnesium-transporting ATPase (P-type)